MFLLLIIAPSAIGFYYIHYLYPESAGPGSGRMVPIDIPRGAGVSEVARRAAQSGAIESEISFAIYLRYSGIAGELRAGRHEIRDDWSPARVAEMLTKGGQRFSARVTIREGWSRFDIAEELEEQGICKGDLFLRATESTDLLTGLKVGGATAEGYLFPETYQMHLDTQPEKVVSRLVQTFHENTKSLFEKRSAYSRELGTALKELQVTLGREPFGLSSSPELDVEKAGRHASIIIASMVEAETALPEERPLVAAVVLNRLRSPEFPSRRLQIDPTVDYGCRAYPDDAPSCASTAKALTTTHLQDGENRYNTYQHPGLPPGPIGNPSLASIKAALAPAAVNFLYFVARGDGGHVFSATLEDHNAAVKRYRALIAESR